MEVDAVNGTPVGALIREGPKKKTIFLDPLKITKQKGNRISVTLLRCKVTSLYEALVAEGQDPLSKRELTLLVLQPNSSEALMIFSIHEYLY
jgi:hypothetical protein